MKIICLTPIKNEAWMLDNFLKAASIWADHIIIADQGSTDNSVEIARKYEKVKLICNNDSSYSECARQTLLINEARKTPGNNILIALDADEFLSANSLQSLDWEKIKKAPQGSTLFYNWNNVLPGGTSYWEANQLMPFGFVDDRKSTVSTSLIHNPRIPLGDIKKHIVLEDIQVLHLQYINWERMQSKHRWYMCYEVIENHKPLWKIYLEYHHMYAVDKNKVKPVPKEWIEEYKKRDIDIMAFKKEKEYWWDSEVLKYFKKYGVERFIMLDIWDKEWKKYKNPQNWVLKQFFNILKWMYPPIYRIYVYLPMIKKNVLKMFDL